VLEGWRPGVAERLGIGPDQCLGRNPGIVYGRVTGWGQQGPLSDNAGHDINFIALAGALEGVGRAGGPPTPPANLVGDFGGGGMLLALGILSALIERGRSGRGQVVDAAMVDGAALLTAFLHGMQAKGFWHEGRGTNMLDSGAARYEVYETADHRWVSVGCIEDRFYANLIALLGLGDDPDVTTDLDRGIGDLSGSAAAKAKLAAVFATKTRDEWCALLEGETELCFAPVLTLNEAPQHPHNRARGTFTTLDEMVQPAPAPRFSRSRPEVRWGAPRRGEHTDEVLRGAGYSDAQIDALRTAGVLD